MSKCQGLGTFKQKAFDVSSKLQKILLKPNHLKMNFSESQAKNRLHKHALQPLTGCTNGETCHMNVETR